MTVSTNLRKAGPYQGDGANTTFTFTFKVFATTDVKVKFTNSAGVESDLTYGVDYSVTINPDQNASPGGTVTYPASGTNYLQAGEYVTPYRDLAFTQETSLPNGGPYYAKTVESAFDKNAMLAQQLYEETSREIKAPLSDTVATNMTLPTIGNRASKYLAFDAAGAPIASAGPSGVPVETIRQRVTGVASLRGITPAANTEIWLSYHTSEGDGGQGTFYGVAGAAAGTYVDNGGTIIVPTGGDGSAAWIREYDGAASVQFWGADKTGASDCSTTITSALSSGIKRLEFDPDGIYKLTSSVTIPSDVELYGNGATIDVAYDGDGFYIANGWTLGTSATVTSTHTNNSTFATTNTVATVTSTTGYAAGDLVSVRGGGTYPQSFFARIESLTSTDITLDDYLLYTLTTPTLYKVTLQNIVIDGFVMYYSVGSVSGTSYLIECTGSGVEIRNCRFGNAGGISRCITCIGAFVDIHDNYFDDVALCIQYFDNAHSTVRNNDFSNFATAIRGVRMDSCAIVENRIINGTNASYGLGIEITAESVSYDKNCRNLVEGNTVINANKGLAGSGIGGIHLNYSAKLNRIINNTCRHNSFGIYLENDCDYNLIEGNVCSDQDGYYGVGIELDFNSSNNIISNNVCENNRGSLTAAESTGIQVRDSGANPCNYNVVIGNTCRNNGLDGIRCGGKWTTVTGNTLEGNGIDVEAFNGADATLLGWGVRVLGPDAAITNNFIHQNAYDSRATSSFTQVAIDINGVTNALVQGNTIVGGYYSNRSISVSNSSDNVLIANNSITCDGATGRAIEVLSSTDVYVNTNLIAQSANGQPAISVNTLDKFSIWGNVFTGAVSTLSLTTATNRYTLGDNV